MRKTIFSLAAAGLIALAVPAGMSAGTASAASLPQCQATEVTLHANGDNTSTCLAREGSPTPLISTHPCGTDTNDFVLYWNGPINVSEGIIPSGPILCIRGSGDLDLAATDPQLDGRHWNDQASAFWAGCSGGYLDQNDGLIVGVRQYFGNSNSGNFDGSGLIPAALPNDSLTVVHLDSNC